MSAFVTRLTRAPLPFDPEAGADLAGRFADLAPELRALLSGAGGCSPYLKALCEHEEDWLRPALARGPEDALAGVLDTIVPMAPDAVAGALRRAKRRVALLAGWPIWGASGGWRR